jgi:hypothetical protein
MVRTSSEKDNYLWLETVATGIQSYTPTLVHGLLQTADYARAVIKVGRPELLAHEVEQLVDTRMHRQGDPD